MSTSTAAIKVNIKLTKEQQERINTDLMNAIIERDNVAFDLAIKNGADIHSIGIKWDGDRNTTTKSLLLEAVARDYEYGALKLIEMGANVFAKDNSNQEVIVIAIVKGNTNIIKALLEAARIQSETTLKRMLETTFSGNTLLHIALHRLATRPVTFHGVVQNDPEGEAQKELSDFYNGDPSLIIFETNNNPISYKGNKELVKLLVRYQPSLIYSPGRNDYTPWQFVHEPRKYKDKFTDCHGSTTIKCLTTESDAGSEVTHMITLANHRGDDGMDHKAIVKTDFTDLKLIFEQAAKAHSLQTAADIKKEHEMHQKKVEESTKLMMSKEKEMIQKTISSVKTEVDTKLKSQSVLISKNTKTAEIAAAIAKSNSAKVEKLDVVVKSSTAKVEQVSAKVEHVSVVVKPLEDAIKKLEELEAMRVNIGKRNFHDLLMTSLDALLEACKVLGTGKIQRTEKTPADIAAKALKAIGEAAPLGFIAKGIAAVVTYFNDQDEKKMNVRITNIVQAKIGQLCEKIAFQLTKQFQHSLQNLSLDQTEELVGNAIELIGKEMLSDPFFQQLTSTHRTLAAQQDFVVQSMEDVVKTNPGFTKKLATFVKTSQQNTQLAMLKQYQRHVKVIAANTAASTAAAPQQQVSCVVM